MRIGIITFHRAINYGAVLQTYALQKFLNVSNYDAEVIDYRCEHMDIHNKGQVCKTDY